MGSSRIFIPVLLSGTSRLGSRSEVESKDPDEVSFAMPKQGILSMISWLWDIVLDKKLRLECIPRIP
jgi:hypothetical protein